MEFSKPVGSLIDDSAVANSAASELLDEDEHAIYCTVIGRLMYIFTQTRPNLSVVTSMLRFYLH